MRSLWSCSSCVSLLLSALVSRGATASHVPLGRSHKDPFVHAVEKAQAQAQITPGPLRRDGEQCTAGYALCASSLNGGCCPTNYACGTDSCYATTAGSTSACEKSGYYACDASAGGGCCPQGYICGLSDCTAPAGVSNTFTSCPASYYLCAASYNYGCCPTTMGCATDACYATTPTTEVYTTTFTTTSGTARVVTTATVVTIATPTPPAGLPTSGSNVAAKFIPTAVAKTNPISSTTSDSGGLSKGAIGGIVGGIAGLLIIVIIGAYFLFKRLNHVARAVDSAKSASQTKSRREMESNGEKLHIMADGTPLDPLIADPNGVSNGSTPVPGTGGVGSTPIPARGRSDSEFSSSRAGDFTSGFVTPAFDENGNPIDYFSVPRPQNIPGQIDQRQYPGGTPPIRGSTDSPHNNNQWGGGQVGHLRHQSEASELSAASSDKNFDGAIGNHHRVSAQSQAVGSPLIAELESAVVSELAAPYQGHVRNGSNGGGGTVYPAGYHSVGAGAGGNRSRASSGASSIASPRPSMTHTRRRSNQGYGAGGSGGAGVGQREPAELAVLPETSETASTAHHTASSYYDSTQGTLGASTLDMLSPTVGTFLAGAGLVLPGSSQGDPAPDGQGPGQGQAQQSGAGQVLQPYSDQEPAQQQQEQQPQPQPQQYTPEQQQYLDQQHLMNQQQQYVYYQEQQGQQQGQQQQQYPYSDQPQQAPQQQQQYYYIQQYSDQPPQQYAGQQQPAPQQYSDHTQQPQQQEPPQPPHHQPPQQ